MDPQNCVLRHDTFFAVSLTLLLNTDYCSLPLVHVREGVRGRNQSDLQVDKPASYIYHPWYVGVGTLIISNKNFHNLHVHGQCTSCLINRIKVAHEGDQCTVQLRIICSYTACA